MGAVAKADQKEILLTQEVFDAELIVILVNLGLFCPVLRNWRTILICPPKLEDNSDLSSESGGQVLQFKKSKLCAMGGDFYKLSSTAKWYAMGGSVFWQTILIEPFIKRLPLAIQ